MNYTGMAIGVGTREREREGGSSGARDPLTFFKAGAWPLTLALVIALPTM